MNEKGTESKPMLKLRTDTTSGTVRIYPDDDISKVMVSLKGPGKACFNMKEMEKLISVFEFTYHGDKHYGLDSLGVKRE